MTFLLDLLLPFLVFHPSPSITNFCPRGISNSIQKVNDYWQKINPRPPSGANSLTWGNGTYFIGNLAAYSATNNDRYYHYALDWATSNDFSFDPSPIKGAEADQLTVGSNYITLFLLDPKRPTQYISPIDDKILDLVESPRNDYWSWVDALFMAMPQFAQLAAIKKDKRYLDKMYALFDHTKRKEGGRGLWDSSKGLWWRDKSFIGTNVYWSRGNGWAIAALARVLEYLPYTDPHYKEYIQTYQQMASALVRRQQADGFWYVNLGNSTDYPGPEASGTLLFIYGITWGINRGLFEPAIYGPPVIKAWNAVVKKAVSNDGFLGYVQGPGFWPGSKQPVTSKSTADFGVGAFLLAGSELVRLCGK